MPRYFTVLVSVFLFSTTLIHAQAVVQAWGNVTGIRSGDRFIALETSLRLVDGGNWERSTGREKNSSTYRRRSATTRQVTTRMDSLFLHQQIEDVEDGVVRVDIRYTPLGDQPATAACFHVRLPGDEFGEALLRQLDPVPLPLGNDHSLSIRTGEKLRTRARGLEIRGLAQRVTITADSATTVVVKQYDHTSDLGIYFLLRSGPVAAGDTSLHGFLLETSAPVSPDTVALELFPDYPGNAFLGLGGNFRLQNAGLDSLVIDYSLRNLEVRMARLELPWSYWHPTRMDDPLAAARRGELHPKVKAAMKLAGQLYDADMPILLATWFPPGWAAEGVVTRDPRHADGTWGNPLRQDRMEEIYASITAYLLFLRENYGVEVDLFSFNEADLGINVRQSPTEHAAFIKGLGEYFAAHGLRTRLLLGDTADANSFRFLKPALDDPSTWPYIGGVSFHSWRGWDKETLQEWYTAADRLNIPLIVGEGSIDAGAWRYPEIFAEDHYAVEEIKLYARLLDICQPEAILQWQLTADYAPLIGGGIFRNDSLPLTETRRFAQLRQLAATPAGQRVIPVQETGPTIYATALLGDNGSGLTVHVVNEGGAQEVAINGIPEGIEEFSLYLTDTDRRARQMGRIRVREGRVHLRLPPAAFATLQSN